MTAFASALDVLFADPNMAVAATFTPEGGEPIAVSVIARRPDRIVEFGDARLHSAIALFDVRVSELANPRPGDLLDVAEESYLIQGEPVRDSERLVWTLSARPL